MEPDTLTIYKGEDGDWRWRLQAAGNHEPIGASTEGYVKLADCMTNIVRTVNLSGDINVVFADEPHA